MLWAASSAEETDTLKPRVISSHLPRGLPEIHSPPPRWGLRDEHLTYLTWLPTAGWHPASVILECKRPCFINRLKECVCARVCVSDSATLWTVAHQAPQSMGFSRQEYWGQLPFPSPGDLPDPAIEPASPALAGGFFTTSTSLGKQREGSSINVYKGEASGSCRTREHTGCRGKTSVFIPLNLSDQFFFLLW